MQKILFLFSFFVSIGLQAQVNFSNANAKFVDSDIHSGIAIAVADMNNDRLDDVVRLNQSNTIVIDYQTLGGNFDRKEFYQVSEEDQWTMAIGDLDNNGYKDILTGGRYDEIKVYFANDDGSDYSKFLMPGASLFAQGSNLTDINNDGFLDAFVCHDDAESRIWENMQNQTFNMADAMIDMSTIPNSDNSGNYGSIWTDFDHDGDTDLYIAKCRQTSTNPSDPRRINALFVNDGNGNFTEMAGEFGLKIGEQSWTADFEDIDNDGDFDCFITSHSGDPQLLENDGSGHFTDISATAGIGYLSFSLQAKMVDMDNDGFVDLLVCGGENAYFKNNGDKTFIRQNNFLNNESMLTFSLGDLDNDGFTDINAGYGTAYTDPSKIDDVLWMNNGNSNNWIGFNLEGTASNRDGVGTIVKITGDWGIQIREVRSGESYGISNSHGIRFGIGAATNISQVEISWPSGITQMISDLSPNQYVYVKEGECIVEELKIEANGPVVFCTGESVVLSAPAGWSNYSWSNGVEDENEITITETGGYQVFYNDGSCIARSNIIRVSVDPDETPSILEGTEAIICSREPITLTSSASNMGVYTWSNNLTGPSIQVSEPGSYNVTVEGLCGDFTSDEFVLDNYLIEIETENDTVASGENAVLLSSGLAPEWYDDPIAGNLLGMGNQFTTDPITTTKDYFVESLVALEPVEETVGLHYNSNLTGEFEGGFYSGLRMDILQPVRLLEFTVYAESAGIRVVSFYNQNTATFIGDFGFDLVEGENILTTDIELEAGENITMYVAENANLFAATEEDQLDFPYVSEEKTVTITSGSEGESVYFFFFNIKFEPVSGQTCLSKRELVQAVLDSDVSTKDLRDAFSIDLHPNPSSGMVFINTALENLDEMEISIYNGLGGFVSNLSSNQNIDLSEFSKGVYFVNFTNKKGTVTRKIILQ